MASFVVSVADRQAALVKRFPVWSSRTLDQMLDAAVSEFADRPFIITDIRQWTYRDVKDESELLARGLLGLGVQARERIAMVIANLPEFVTLKYAISRIGAIAVPVNFLNKRDELAYVLQQSGSVVLVTMDSFRDLDYLSMLDELSPGWVEKGGGRALPSLRQIVVLPTKGRPERQGVVSFASLRASPASSATTIAPSQPDAICDIIYTSGTTGSPKGVQLSHDMLLRTAFGSAYARAFFDGQRSLFSLPLYHVFGYVEGLLAVVFVGGAIVPRLRFDAKDTLEAISLHRVTDLLSIPTTTLALLAELKGSSYDLSSLRTILASGGSAPETIWAEIEAAFGQVEVTTGYGMTEVTASTTVTRPDDPIERLRTTNGRLRRVGPAADPSLNGLLVAYRVTDPESGKDVRRGEIGELVARGLGVTPGYHNNPEATAVAMTPDGWFRTGDLGLMDDEDYVCLVGRLKESYRCGGEQVLPSEVERALISHPSLTAAYVVPLPDENMGETGVAFVVFREGAAATAEEIILWCEQRLARFKVPRHVLPMQASEVPVTPSGRPQKFLLAKRAKELLGQSQADTRGSKKGTGR